MTNLINKNRNKILPSQNRYLPIILWLFPLLLLNIGWYFFAYIDHRWVENEWIDKAKQKAEFLAASSDLPYCIGKISGSFIEDLKSRVETFEGLNHKANLSELITNLATYKFRKPFPEHKLFVFKIPADKNKAELLYSSVENIIGKRALGNTFDFFVRLNSLDKTYSENDKKVGSSMARKFLGFECDPSVLAETQRGKVSYSLYDYKPHYFIWDYFKNNKSGDIYGLFLLIENNVDSEIGSKLIALRELNNYDDNDSKKSYGAFIPLFPGFGGVISNEELAKMPEFKKAVREWIPKNINELYDWQFKDTSKLFKNTRIGNYQAFFHISAGMSHAAVLLKPVLDKAGLPFWLYLFNIILISIITLLLFRGFLLGIWPSTSLKIRFITTYFLAACMPLGLLIIASYGYISEYQHSALFNNLSQLRFCINQFDTRKIQNQEEYKTAFFEIINDPVFQDCIKRFDKVNINKPKEFPKEAKEVLNRALEIINKNSRILPIIGLTIIDERGNCFSNYGNRNCQVFKLLEDKDYKEYKGSDFDSSITQDELVSKEINDKSVNVLMYSFVQTLRNKIKESAPETKKWVEELTPNLFQETAIGGFKNAAGGEGKLNEVLDQHRSMCIDRLVGDKIISQIYDNIYIDGIPRFVFYFTWDVAGLDDKTFKSSLDYFSLQEPNFVFSAFKSSPLGIKRWMDSGRHGREFEKISQTLANQAYFRRSNISYHDDNMSVIAVPSKKYEDTFIVGGVSHYNLQMPVFKRIIIFFSIIAIALIIFLFCVYYSFKIFLKPIDNLKQVLDEVADGNLDIEINSSSKDEFGIMSHEFSVMTRELSERNKLATLLSDHAVEALSKNEYANEANTDVETFKGTALVTDIRNFTGMCEKYEPEQITDLLNEHFASMTKIFSAYNGRIYKYIGDAIEVVFSDNDDYENKSFERAFSAALEMLETLKEINQKRRNNNLFEYKIGVGLCYSTMSSGSIGSLETRLDYAILGDALKNAAKLESFSKLNPEFPLIVDNNFISYFKNEKIHFSLVKSEDGLEGYKIDNSCLSSLHDIISSRKTIKKEEKNYTDLMGKNNSSESSKSLVDTYEIEDKISFGTKLFNGFILLLFFVSVLTSGLYYTNKFKNDSKLLDLTANNQRVIEQMLGDIYGKVAFDNKCRIFAQKLQEKFNELTINDITDEIISKALTDCRTNDLSIKEIGLKSVFVRVGEFDNNEIKEDDLKAYFEKRFPVYPVANIGYNEKELKLICDTYKILHLNDIPKLNDHKKDFIRKNYGEPCKEVFGDKIYISRLRQDLKNTSTEAIMRGEDSFLFTLDFPKKTVDTNNMSSEKTIGYLIMSMPAKNAYKSIPFILSCFSRNGENIILKNKNTDECYFSESVPAYVKDKIRNIVLEKKADESLSKITEYLNSAGGILNNGIIKLDNQPYDIFFIGLLGQNNNLTLFDYLIISLSVFIFIWVLKGILKGTSIFNKSISAKLWLALLIVAVIPVLTVFFVPSLFLNEYLSVKKSLKRGEMQRFMGIFEQKMDFSMPIIWNDLKKKNNDKELNKCIEILNNSDLSKDVRNDSIRKMRSIIESWLDSDNRFSKDKDIKKKEKSIIGYKLTDVTITGKGGWSFSLSDDVSKDSIENRPISLKSFKEKSKDNKDVSNNVFGNMMKLISKSLLERKQNNNTQNKINSSKVLNEYAVETSLDTIRTLFGDDTFIKMSHGINTITVFDNGFGKFGVMIGAVPDYENPSAIFVWMINFDNFYYMERNTDKVESEFRTFTSENFRYGIAAKETDDNNFRIPVGEYGSWIAASNLPLSTNIEINKEKYLVEGAAALNQLNSLLEIFYSEKDFIKEVNNMAYVFYILLTVSLIIIIITTKNIADDIINPVNALIFGIKEVNRENFSFRINSDRNDELGVLCLSFDKMTKGLDEKRMMSRMLSKTARMVTLDEDLATSGKTDAVLLYIGIPDFSKVMKYYRDYEVFALLKQHTSVMAGIIMDEGGEVDKIIGEKMLAVFRVSNNESEIALAAYRVAKQILELERSNKLSFSISIGLNYGKVINGFLGVGTKRDFTVIGDPVNVTARIESLAESLESNRCLISETFYKLVQSSITAKEFGEVELKGKSQPMKVYNLL